MKKKMQSYSVHFKNAGTIYLITDATPGEIQTRISADSVKTLLVSADLPPDSIPSGSTDLLRTDLSAFQRKDFESVRTSALKALSAVRKGNVIVYADQADSEAAAALLGCILLSVPRNRLKPEDLKKIHTLPFETVPDIIFDFYNYSSETVKQDPIPREEPPTRINQENRAAISRAVTSESSSPPTPAEEPFTPSWLTIRVKLASVIPGIIALALITMITTAGWLFKSHTDRVVQEYNLSLARLIGKKTEDAVSELRKKTIFISEIQNAKGSYPELTDMFFRENPELILIAEVKASGETLLPARFLVNKDYLNRTGFKEEDIMNSLPELSDNLTAVIQGETMLMNASPVFGRSLIALSFPYKKDSGLLVLADSSDFMDSFQTVRNADFFQIMLVSDTGRVIAHSDDKETLLAPDYSSVPVVSAMKQSKSDNASLRYIFKETEYLGSYQILKTGRLGVISTVESDRVFEAVYRIERQNIILTFIVMIISFLIVFIFSRRITVPIARLVGATREIESGNYHVSIKPVTRDEIGILTNSFSAMARGLYERETIKDIFGKFVNRTIAEKALRGEIKLGGEKKEAAVFFSDLRNFTGISESMKPEDVVEMLNYYFTAMVDCVHATGGVVDKYIGDALMAQWGALTSGDNNTKNAVDAALLMREELISMNQIAGGRKFPVLHFGAGINTGPVIAGQIGSEKKLEFTVIGDTVNLASRIEYLNKHFGTDILISSYSYEKVKDYYEVIEMPALSIKGKTNKETVYAVLGHKGDPSCPRSLEELREKVGIRFTEEQAEESLKASSDKVHK